MPRIQPPPVLSPGPAPTIATALRSPLRAAFAGTANLPASVALEGGRVLAPARRAQGCLGGALRRVRNTLAACVAPPRMTPYERVLAAWARVGAASERRADAVDRLQAFLDTRNARALNLQGLDLRELPPLPEHLQGLNCSHNQLTHLPTFPASMHLLVLSGNPLHDWPVLPPRLASLEVVGCGLAAVGTLPQSLFALDISGNRIARLPPELPSGLSMLLAEDNALTHLPAGMERLPSLNRVLLHGNPLARETLDQVEEWNALHGMDTFVTEPLPDTDEMPTILTPELERLRELEEAEALDPEAAFTRFLDRLRSTVNARNQPGFADELDAWRKRLDADPDLRATTLAIALGANASCEDRATLTYLAMRRAETMVGIDAGRHDHDAVQLLALLRHHMREEAVDRMAFDRIRKLEQERPDRPIDEIETILHYRIGIGDLLPQAGEVREGRFATTPSSGVANENLDDARASLRHLDSAFPRYLSNLPSWQAVLERWNPDAVAAARERRAELGDADAFNKRVASWLRAEHEGLEADTGAQVNAGPAALEQLNHEVFWPLTQRFLQERGVSLD